jgi:hypothetical protein
VRDGASMCVVHGMCGSGGCKQFAMVTASDVRTLQGVDSLVGRGRMLAQALQGVHSLVGRGRMLAQALQGVHSLVGRGRMLAQALQDMHT